jgi:hypothetical protein
LTSKTAEAIAKPLLDIISKPNSNTDGLFEEEKDTLSATLLQENFFDDSESPENKNLRSKTLVGKPHLYKTFTMPLDYQASPLVEDS